VVGGGLLTLLLGVRASQRSSKAQGLHEAQQCCKTRRRTAGAGAGGRR